MSRIRKYENKLKQEYIFMQCTYSISRLYLYSYLVNSDLLSFNNRLTAYHRCNIIIIITKYVCSNSNTLIHSNSHSLDFAYALQDAVTRTVSHYACFCDVCKGVYGNNSRVWYRTPCAIPTDVHRPTARRRHWCRSCRLKVPQCIGSRLCCCAPEWGLRRTSGPSRASAPQTG